MLSIVRNPTPKEGRFCVQEARALGLIWRLACDLPTVEKSVEDICVFCSVARWYDMSSSSVSPRGAPKVTKDMLLR